MCKENWKSVTDMENCVYWRRRRRQVWVFSDPLSWNIIRPDTKVPGLLKSFNPSFHLSINHFVACTRLFNRLCLMVGRTVILCFFGVFLRFCTTVTAPMYGRLNSSMPLPIRTQLWQPCFIRMNVIVRRNFSNDTV